MSVTIDNESTSFNRIAVIAKPDEVGHLRSTLGRLQTVLQQRVDAAGLGVDVDPIAQVDLVHDLGDGLERGILQAKGARHHLQAAQLALVAERGRCMQRAVSEGSGAMAAILGLDDATVMDVCNTAAEGSVVSAVN